MQDVFDSWTKQQVNSLTLKVIRNYRTQNQVVITLESPNNLWIPYNFITETSNEASQIEWISTTFSSLTIAVPTLTATEFLLCNVNQFGLYRVDYDQQNWQLISDALRNNLNSINPLTRAQLIDDSLNLARFKQLQFSIPFNLITYLEEELDYIPWLSAITILDEIDLMLTDDDTQNNFRVRFQLKIDIDRARA